jgi:FkbM family methyltransferase
MKTNQIYTTGKKLIEKITGFTLYRKSTPWGVSLFNDIDRLLVNWQPEIVFDIGANKGQTAIAFNKKWPKAKIFSFEPVSDTFEELQANTSKVSNVESFNLAMGSECGQGSIKLFGKSSSNLASLDSRFTKKPDSNYETVTITTVNDFCNNKSISKINLLKIDTEGHDLEVLKGSIGLLKKNKIDTIFVEFSMRTTPGKVTLCEIYDFLKDYKMICTGIYDQHFGLYYGNAFFIRKELL